jgi:hypothetical protein
VAEATLKKLAEIRARWDKVEQDTADSSIRLVYADAVADVRFLLGEIERLRGLLRMCRKALESCGGVATVQACGFGVDGRWSMTEPQTFTLVPLGLIVEIDAALGGGGDGR